jgi:signal transduction histidine kinase
MFTLFLAAPFLVLLVMIFIFAGLAVSRNTSTQTLEAPGYMIKPIETIIENNFAVTDESLGVLLMIDNKGNILYPSDSHNNSSISRELSRLYGELINSELEAISMTRFIYNGVPGFCFFDNSFVPVMLKQHIRIGISVFIVIISCLGLIFGQFSTVVINSSIRNLVMASDLIANGNLDEEVVLKYDNELKHVAEAMDKMRRELREKRNIEQRFVMSVTHDLKTPLTSINGYLEAISDGVISDQKEVVESTRMMQLKTELLDSRINELLDYSRNRTAGWRDNWKSLEVRKWLLNITTQFSSDAKLYDRVFLSDIEIDDTLKIVCNDKLLTRALENLFDNAYRYSENGDTITFSAQLAKHSGKKKLSIIMADSGSGINDEDMENIFELFYRNDRGRNSRGMGIGLASVQTIIKDHGGHISCSKSSSGGAEFTILLDC